MHSESIGKIVNKLRKKAGITKRALALGICPEATISRLESGEQIPDVLTLEAIFSRLGKSVNKLEILFQNTDYADYCFYQNLEAELEAGNRAEAERIIEILQKREKWKKPVYCQCLKKAQYLLQKDMLSEERKKELLEDAIRETLPDFQTKKATQYIFSEEEIILILMWFQVRNKLGDISVHGECSCFLSELERRNYDEEIWVAVYPKAVWVLIQSNEKSEGIREILRLKANLEMVCKVRKLLTENGVLLCFTEFLELELSLLQKLEMEEEYRCLKMQRDALKWVYDSYGQEYPSGEIEIWKKYRQQNIYLLQETIKKERKYRKLTQEELAELAQLDQKTLSRIETGANDLKRGTFCKLQEALNLERDLCSTKVDADDFETLELERNLTREMVKKNYFAAERLFGELKCKLPMESRKNKQYVEYKTIILELGEGKIEEAEALSRAKKAFEMTRKIPLENECNIILNHLECAIVVLIANLYRKSGELEKAITILETVLQGYEKTEISIKNNYKELTVMLGWLTGMYEEEGQFDKAVQYADCCIRLEIQCGRINLLGRRVLERYYIEERMGQEAEICVDKYHKVYQIFLLLNPTENLAEMLKEYLHQKYNEDVV